MSDYTKRKFELVVRGSNYTVSVYMKDLKRGDHFFAFKESGKCDNKGYSYYVQTDWKEYNRTRGKQKVPTILITGSHGFRKKIKDYIV